MPHVGHYESMTLGLPGAYELAIGASPATVSPGRRGLLLVSGGIVVFIEYGRGATFTTLNMTAGLIPLAAGDTVRITYAVAPTITFIQQ